jgi:hypothetical protein
VLLALALMLSGAACGEDSSNGGGTSGMAGTSGAGGAGGAGGMAGASGAGGGGQTLCGIQTCEAGQHCNNGVCVNGCLTAANCLQGQTCEDIDSLSQIGTCRAAAVAPMKDCQAFCDKALACMDPDVALCEQQCTGLSAECVSCVIDSNCGVGCDAVCEL